MQIWRLKKQEKQKQKQQSQTPQIISSNQNTKEKQTNDTNQTHQNNDYNDNNNDSKLTNEVITNQPKQDLIDDYANTQLFLLEYECRAMIRKKRDSLCYGIENREKIKLEHLHSIIIYCDFSKICTAFFQYIQGFKK